MHADERLESVMGNGGIEDCGKAQNCVELSKEIPLVDSIAVIGRETTKRMLFGWLLANTTSTTNLSIQSTVGRSRAEVALRRGPSRVRAATGGAV